MISRWYLIPSTADPAREIARSFVVKAISRWYFHHSGAVAMPPCCGSYCNSYGRPSWLLQLPRQYLSLCHRSLPRGRSRNQNRNHQNNSRLHRQMIFPFWKDGLRWPRQYDIAMIFLKGLRGDIHNQVEKTNAQWMASDPSSSCIRGPTGLLYRFHTYMNHVENVFLQILKVATAFNSFLLKATSLFVLILTNNMQRSTRRIRRIGTNSFAYGGTMVQTITNGYFGGYIGKRQPCRKAELKKCINQMYNLRNKINDKGASAQHRAVSGRMITDLEMNGTYRRWREARIDSKSRAMDVAYCP